MDSTTIESIRDDFGFLDDWEDRYRYVIELGRKLAPLAESARNSANKVQGCASQVWIDTKVSGPPDNPRLDFTGDSDALIVKGLIAIVFALLSGRPAKEILATDAQAVLDSLGLKDHLTPQRSNGLASMVARIRSDALRALAK
ncbi:MAG: SufE family protein [Rhizobiales bacterium]|nr:SufE family protein [Hyphomicrobiales bacterium]